MALAIFDLDNTLLAGDSDHRWGKFLCEQGLVEAGNFQEKNDQFYADYRAGTLDMCAYLDFVLAPLEGKTRTDVRALQRQFIGFVSRRESGEYFTRIVQNRVSRIAVLPV